jgi:hypothetical protein
VPFTALYSRKLVARPDARDISEALLASIP